MDLIDWGLDVNPCGDRAHMMSVDMGCLTWALVWATGGPGHRVCIGDSWRVIVCMVRSNLVGHDEGDCMVVNFCFGRMGGVAKGLSPVRAH